MASRSLPIASYSVGSWLGFNLQAIVPMLPYVSRMDGVDMMKCCSWPRFYRASLEKDYAVTWFDQEHTTTAAVGACGVFCSFWFVSVVELVFVPQHLSS